MKINEISSETFITIGYNMQLNNYDFLQCNNLQSPIDKSRLDKLREKYITNIDNQINKIISEMLFISNQIINIQSKIIENDINKYNFFLYKKNKRYNDKINVIKILLNELYKQKNDLEEILEKLKCYKEIEVQKTKVQK